MARLGWVGFASDAYGEGRTASTDEEAGKLMGAALADPAALRRRLAAALAAMAREDGVDPTRLAAIGFCFGGLCALELARSGADLRGAVSFHGFLRPPDPALPSRPRARLLVLHGSADPLVPWDQMDAFRTEMTSAGADWEAIAYGGAAHGFTNPSAASPERGIVHHSEVARRAWARAQTFLADAFAG
jgi:dienelactone hydrolase